MLGEIIADLLIELVARPFVKGVKFVTGALKRGVSKATAQFRRGAADAKSEEAERVSE
ncbi:hypothetical protein [Haloferax elongans]|uniref:hypothetical protein n=1 Tax=Haloferax elongans TaxID=403191 RepID=UPI000A5BEE56|nr:hypothetical protein [Haloferax elongans]